jgi:hypothetical protein
MSKQTLKEQSGVVPSVQEEATKSIKNYSLQGITVILKNGNKTEDVWLLPKQSIRVSESQITQQIRNLHRRRLVIIGN